MRKPASLSSKGMAGMGALIVALLLGMATPAAAAPPIGPNTVQLHLLWIACEHQNDEIGSDEPYVLVNGARVFSRSNFDTGDTDWIELWFPFDGYIQVDLWEDDGGLTGRDDHMGTFYMWPSEAGTGAKTVITPGGPGVWWLRYEVV